MKIEVIDSHTAGEPTRVVIGGFPDLVRDSMAARRAVFSEQFDHLRRGILLEPRGSEVLVGALLTAPVSEDAAAGVIFFNNVGMLGMCGHGTIAVVETLRFLGRLGPGSMEFDTPVGSVSAVLREDGEVELENVVAYRYRKDVSLDTSTLPQFHPSTHAIVGDVAYGGNWFFLGKSPLFDIRPGRIPELTATAERIRLALREKGITGADGAEIDHIELFSEDSPQSKSFVLCPGGQFDRSPCGTGTSAKIACLIEDGKLAEGEPWVQESVTGGRFTAHGRKVEGGVLPTIIGRAHITATSTLIFNEDDPYRWGLR